MSGLFTPFWYEPARHVYRLFTNRHYRTFCILETRLGHVPRFTDCRTRINGWDLSIPDSASFLSAYKEIFVGQIYRFHSGSAQPSILDLGANIGLSVLFFKSLYPDARITAFEADPNIFSHLKQNVHGNGFTDVQLINKAAWNENTTLQFSSEGADGGRVAFDGDRNILKVDAIDIKTFLEGHQWDFLKMDIEGAEEFVLPACKDHIDNFKYVFVEYHSKTGHKQCLDRILTILKDADFRIHIHSVLNSPSPFIKVDIASGFDLQLNIFAWKN